VDAASDRLLGDREYRPFLLQPDDRVALAVEPNEIAVVDPCCRNSIVVIALALMNRK